MNLETEVERLRAENAGLAELAALRARCERQDGDPSVEELRHVVRGGYADAPIAIALLRAWGEPLDTADDSDPRGLKETLERLP